MFGLVKASRLRAVQAELDIEEKEHQRQEVISHRKMLNWQAIAESRLVAVLLLRDRYANKMADVDTTTSALLRSNAELTSQRDDARSTTNALTAKWEAAVAASALNAEAVNAAKDALAKFHDDLTAISSIAFTLQPEIETAIIRPSSTNRLRWRVNDDDGKALCQSSTGYATADDAAAAFARAAFLISLDSRAPEDDRIERIREVLTREPDTV